MSSEVSFPFYILLLRIFVRASKTRSLFPHSIQQCMLLSDIEFYLSYTNVIQAATLLMLNVKYERVSW